MMPVAPIGNGVQIYSVFKDIVQPKKRGVKTGIN
jgi:hypothetical protein